MTDSPTPAEPGPVDPAVELASAHLDGEAGADERARVGDPAVEAHRAAFAEVADAVREVPPPPPGLLDDHVAAAMDAFDGDARVVPLGRSRTAQPWWQRIPLGAVAAGLVIVALIGAIGLASTIEGDDDDTATASLDAADDSGESAEATDGADGDASAGATMEDSAALDADEGSQPEASGGPIAYGSADDLVDDVRARLADDPDEAEAPTEERDLSTTTPAEPDGDDGDDERVEDPCDAVAQLGIDPADVVLAFPAVLTGDEVTVVVHDADGRRITVVDDATCTVTLDRPL
ncbi:hypothetical protein NHL50_03335 [Acidimicrobiia bacterium EGI L10123]|uniref:hypothetical protein n=1 Tax=Salinilacustrithrix flava TaxID=2957203 RepID=UPI003D7C1A8B|nr:hypothetical protein [Acidimicrobiia bacterium EGI L10123]